MPEWLYFVGGAAILISIVMALIEANENAENHRE